MSLLADLRRALRLRHYSRRTEQAYVRWVRRFVEFHGRRHPRTLGAPEVTSFLTHLAVRRRVSAATQNQALHALLFYYRHVLGERVGWLGGLVRAAQRRRLPVVLTQGEVQSVLAQLRGTPRLVAWLLYGAGLRLGEALPLRVKDIEFARRRIVVREAKGGRDRVTTLPAIVVPDLQRHLCGAEQQFRRDLRDPKFGVPLPSALAEKYPQAHRRWVWQWFFPATRTYVDQQTGRRHDTIFIAVPYSVPFTQPYGMPACRSAPRAIRSGTPLQPTYSSTATTSGPCRNSSATATCARR
jgi:integron integrase